MRCSGRKAGTVGAGAWSLLIMKYYRAVAKTNRKMEGEKEPEYKFLGAQLCNYSIASAGPRSNAPARVKGGRKKRSVGYSGLLCSSLTSDSRRTNESNTYYYIASNPSVHLKYCKIEFAFVFFIEPLSLQYYLLLNIKNGISLPSNLPELIVKIRIQKPQTHKKEN